MPESLSATVGARGGNAHGERGAVADGTIHETSARAIERKIPPRRVRSDAAVERERARDGENLRVAAAAGASDVATQDVVAGFVENCASHIARGVADAGGDYQPSTSPNAVTPAPGPPS